MATEADAGSLRQATISVALEAWKLAKLLHRVIGKLDAGDQQRYLNQARFSLKRIETNLSEHGIRFVSHEGSPFEAGMAATALNLADFSSDETLIVDLMLEPIVMGPEGVLRPGTLMLRRP